MGDTKNQSSRRDFLKDTTAVAAGIALAGGLDIARMAHAAGSDELKIALIGCGGRGTGAATDCLSANENVKLIALADAFEDRPPGPPKTCSENYPQQDRRAQRPHLRRLRRLPEGHRQRRGYRAFGHAARVSAHPLRRRHPGRQTRLHGETLLRRRPRFPLP